MDDVRNNELVKKAEAMAHVRLLGTMQRNGFGLVVDHSKRVAQILADRGCGPTLVAAAHAHDLLDYQVSDMAELSTSLSSGVAALVSSVTRPHAIRLAPDPVRAEVSRVSQLPKLTQTLKMAEVLDNLRSAIRVQGHGARGYLVAMMPMIRGLKEADQEIMWDALQVVRGFLAESRMPEEVAA